MIDGRRRHDYIHFLTTFVFCFTAMLYTLILDVWLLEPASLWFWFYEKEVIYLF